MPKTETKGERVACLWLPDFALQVHRRRHPGLAEQKLAIVDRDHPLGRILEVESGASRSVVLPGMRYSQALSLDLELCCVVWDSQAVAQEQQSIGQACLDWTPDVESYPKQDGVFWLFYTGMQRLFPSAQAWGQGIIEHFSAQGWKVKVALGFGRLSSLAAVRCQEEPLWMASDAQRELAKASQGALQDLALPAKDHKRLDALGLHTLGQLWALDAGALPDRFGQELRDWHALGQREDWGEGARVRQYKESQVEIDLEEPIKHSRVVMARLGEVIPRMAQALFDGGYELSGAEIEFSLVAVWGKSLAHRRSEWVGLACPGRDPGPLLRLIELRLESQPLRAPVARMEIRLRAARAVQKQGSLWASLQSRDLQEGEQALAVIRAELGNDAVQRAVLCDEHVPEQRFRWEPFETLKSPPQHEASVSGLVRRIQKRSQAIKDLSCSALNSLWGPFVLDSGWWMQGVNREEYYIKDEQGFLRWVFFDGNKKRWFSQGEVG